EREGYLTPSVCCVARISGQAFTDGERLRQACFGAEAVAGERHGDTQGKQRSGQRGRWGGIFWVQVGNSSPQRHRRVEVRESRLRVAEGEAGNAAVVVSLCETLIGLAHAQG